MYVCVCIHCILIIFFIIKTKFNKSLTSFVLQKKIIHIFPEGINTDRSYAVIYV